MNQTLPTLNVGSPYLKLCSLSEKQKYFIAPLLPSCLCYGLIFPSSVKCSECPSPPPPPPRLRELEPRPAEFTAKRKWFSTFHEVLQFYTSTLLQFYTFSQLSCSKQRIRIFIFIQRRLKLISSVWTLHPYLAISWFICKNIRIMFINICKKLTCKLQLEIWSTEMLKVNKATCERKSVFTTNSDFLIPISSQI